jgi:hypothetical protein
VLIRKDERGLVVASPLGPFQRENFTKSPQGKPLYQISQIYLKLGSLFVDAGTEG